MKNSLLFAIIILITSCTKEFVLDVRVNPPNSGTVFPSQGTYKDGSTVTLNAAPSTEYVFLNWSGDVTGNNPTIGVEVNDNKNIVANFRLKQYGLITRIIGKGRISETIINSNKTTDYDSGTRVRLEAIPAEGYYFTGWSGALSGDSNPIEITIDSPKSVTATFEKLSYELSIQIQGEGTVNEEIIDISEVSDSQSNKFTDYEYGTIVRLTPTPAEGSDFIEWEVSGEITESNPLDIVVSEPTTVNAIFEYDLFNLSVGKWKINKPNRTQQKAAYDVYNVILNRDRSFKINYSSGQISGTFSVTSNSNIVLENIGLLSNVQVNGSQISFNINITGLFQFDVIGTKDENYQQNKTYIPDQNFEQALIDSGYDSTIDSYIDDSSKLSITQLDLSNKQILDFTGLEEFINLTDLNLSGNTVSSVLLVNLNQLTSLDLSNTGLTELDLSQNNGLTNLILTGNPNLSCVKVSDQIYQQIPSGWTYDSTTGFELECDCPTLSLISGNQNQTICDGEAMEDITFEFGGKDVNINVSTMPGGIQSNVSSGTVTISGTPIFNSDSYTFSVFTTDGKANCNQVSQTVTLTKNSNSPSLSVVSGSINQSISTGAIGAIEVSYGGTATDLSITGLPTSLSVTKSGQTYTIQGSIFTAGTYNGTITTVSIGGCTEITRGIQIVVTAPVVANTGGTTSNNNSSNTSSSTAASDTSNNNIQQCNVNTSTDLVGDLGDGGPRGDYNGNASEFETYCEGAEVVRKYYFSRFGNNPDLISIEASGLPDGLQANYVNSYVDGNGADLGQTLIIQGTLSDSVGRYDFTITYTYDCGNGQTTTDSRIGYYIIRSCG